MLKTLKSFLTLALILSLNSFVVGPGLIDVAPRIYQGQWGIETTSYSGCGINIWIIGLDNDFSKSHRTNQHYIFLPDVPSGKYKILVTEICTGNTETKIITVPK